MLSCKTSMRVGEENSTLGEQNPESQHKSKAQIP
jgi:hypothetical protein